MSKLCYNSSMLTMNYRYRIYPDIAQQEQLLQG